MRGIGDNAPRSLESASDLLHGFLDNSHLVSNPMFLEIGKESDSSFSQDVLTGWPWPTARSANQKVSDR